MRLTPNDIINKQFSRSRTGFSASEVEDYLRSVAGDFETCLAETARCQGRLEEMEREVERFRAIEFTLKEALVLAQMTANETRSLAHREASAILAAARNQADEITRDSTLRSESLRQERLRFGWEFRALLQSQLDYLDAELARSTQIGPVNSDASTESRQRDVEKALSDDSAGQSLILDDRSEQDLQDPAVVNGERTSSNDVAAGRTRSDRRTTAESS